MTPTPAVALTVSQEIDLAVGNPDAGMHVFIEVRTRGVDPAALGGPPRAAEVIIVDCSGSMGSPPTKLEAAQRAAGAAVDALRDGTEFAVVRGTHQARMAFPRHAERLEVADHDSRARAKARIGHLFAEGGTAIGSWLRLTRDLLAMSTAEVRHAVLLTDGHNVVDRELLDDELALCEGKFVCDARGIGTGWNSEELIRVAGRLNGTASAVLRESDLEAEFERSIRTAMARTLHALTLRVSLTRGVGLRFLRQVHPTLRDLTADGVHVDERAVEFATHPWAGDEVRQYHLCLTADPKDATLDETMQLAWVEVASGSDRVPDPAPEPVLVRWRHGSGPPTEMSQLSKHFSLHEDLTLAAAAAHDAYQAGDGSALLSALGTTVRLAHQLGHAEVLAEVAEIADVHDPVAGKVAIKPAFDGRRLGRLLMLGHVSVAAEVGPRPAPERLAPVDPALVLVPCRKGDCPATLPPGTAFCGTCGTAQDGAPGAGRG
ncbi:vWA domain-containing protein [Streptomyces sp. PT12]|uniref:VWA domain-containing protein n=1 Tax=Streptomyces sp. PT12 TaxID=1510197 RepID=UPI000DE3CFA4|nr:vWA domain-containing protein [Streptomyces sp. PT12]RBM07371.1 VWA domain-containing protein [Streptomyces sp. PT12]